jgi:hypothetical protein
MAYPRGPRVGDNADAAQIAEAVFAIWAEIDDALTPILGPQGVVALFRRSLHLTTLSHPWVTAQHDGTPTSMDPAALKAELARQSSAVAAVGGNAFLQNFYELLASLVGASLAERLLRSVWANSSSGTTAKDISA